MLTVPDQWKVAASSVCETKMGMEGINIHSFIPNFLIIDVSFITARTAISIFVSFCFMLNSQGPCYSYLWWKGHWEINICKIFN